MRPTSARARLLLCARRASSSALARARAFAFASHSSCSALSMITFHPGRSTRNPISCRFVNRLEQDIDLDVGQMHHGGFRHKIDGAGVAAMRKRLGLLDELREFRRFRRFLGGRIDVDDLRICWPFALAHAVPVLDVLVNQTSLASSPAAAAIDAATSRPSARHRRPASRAAARPWPNLLQHQAA